MFEFDLSKDKMTVTNNEEAYQEHQYFKKHLKEIEARIKEVPPEFVKLEEARIQNFKKVVRKPAGLKIDAYLEKYGEIPYTYDFGDDWRILVTLEKTIEDYHYGYPTLIDGEGTAPPEDAGGLMGYSYFLEIYHNSKHPEHKVMRDWAASLYYREYDPDFINYMLKHLKYKKTEWDKINDGQ